MSDDLREAVARRGSLIDTIRTVAWAFFGVRRRSGFLQEASRVNPLHVLVAGVIGAVLFVLVLLAIVHWVVGSVTQAS